MILLPQQPCAGTTCVQPCSVRFPNFNVLKIMWIRRGKCRFLGFHLRGLVLKAQGGTQVSALPKVKVRAAWGILLRLCERYYVSEKRCFWKTLSIPWMTRGFWSMSLIARVACANIEMAGRTTTYVLWNEQYCSVGKLGIGRAWRLPTPHSPGSSVLLW